MQVQRVQNNPQPQLQFGMALKISKDAQPALTQRAADLIDNGKAELADKFVKSIQDIGKRLGNADAMVHLHISGTDAKPFIVTPYHRISIKNAHFEVQQGSEYITLRGADRFSINGEHLGTFNLNIKLPNAELAKKAYDEFYKTSNEYLRAAFVTKHLDNEFIQKAAEEALKKEQKANINKTFDGIFADYSE